MTRADGEYEGIDGGKLDAKTIFTAIGVGAGLGFAMLKSATFLPDVVAKQFSWSDLRLIKVYTSALVTTLLVQAVISGTQQSKFEFARGASKNGRGAVSVAVGCLIMGAGVTFCASLPSLAFIQVGTNIQNTIFIWLAGMCVPVVYGFLYNSIFGKIDDSGDLKYLDDYIKADYWVLALPVALCFGALCFYFEASHTADLKEWIPDPRLAKWHPYATGLFIGLLQLPLMLVFGARIAVLAAYTSPASCIIAAIGDKLNWNTPGYFVVNSKNCLLWQLIMWVSAGLSAGLTAYLCGGMGQGTGPPVWKAFAGGFMLHSGAIIAGGGIFEHFVSGVADLSLSSLIGSACIVLGGLAMSFAPGFLEQYTGFLAKPLIG